MTRRVGLGAALVLLAVAAILPDPRSRGSDAYWLAAPLDWALRVPQTAVLLSWTGSPLDPGDRLVGLQVAADRPLVNLETRAQLEQLLANGASGRSVLVAIGRGEATLKVPAVLARTSPHRLAAEQWILVLAGGVCLLFGCLALGGGRHPATSPLFALSLCLGIGLLSLLDLALPADRGLLGVPSLRSRIGALAWTLLPATLLHLAMRFPVLAEQFRKPALEASPYGVMGTLGLIQQLRFENAVLGSAVEEIAIVSSYVAASVLGGASLARVRSLRPIERYRTHALFVGLAPGLLAPPLLLLVDGFPPPVVSALLVLSSLALPVSLGWGVARYQLLDPPPWLRSALASAITGLVAFLLASVVFSAGFKLFSTPSRWPPRYVGMIAVCGIGLYQALHWSLDRLLRGRSRAAAAGPSVLAEAVSLFSEAADPNEVGTRLAGLLRRRLAFAAVEAVALDPLGSRGRSRLAAQGLEIWSALGEPSSGIVELDTRDDDPAADRPALLIPICMDSRLGTLIVVAGRLDGLPTSREEVRLLETLWQIAREAAQAALTAAELERRVAARTRSLSRLSSDRSRVLFAARDIFAAEEPEAVLEVLDRFLRQANYRPEWSSSAPEAIRTDEVLVELEVSPGTSRFLIARGIQPVRAQELEATIHTVVAFARLALSRLEMLLALKLEVRSQSSHATDPRQRNGFLDLVRGVAHELRKPAEEIRQIASGIDGDSSTRDKIDEIIATSREMSRRISLLLYYGGLHFNMRRIDLVRVIDEGVARIRTTTPDRRYEIEHEMRQLPLLGDASRLVSLVENLLDNAARATEGGGLVRVSSGLTSGREPNPEQVSLWLEVRDDGHGIPSEGVGRVFEPGISLTPGGFGLGLALCREVAQRHGGSVRVRSVPGDTVFRVELPQWLR